MALFFVIGFVFWGGFWGDFFFGGFVVFWEFFKNCLFSIQRNICNNIFFSHPLHPPHACYLHYLTEGGNTTP